MISLALNLIQQLTKKDQTFTHAKIREIYKDEAFIIMTFLNCDEKGTCTKL